MSPLQTPLDTNKYGELINAPRHCSEPLSYKQRHNESSHSHSTGHVHGHVTIRPQAEIPLPNPLFWRGPWGKYTSLKSRWFATAVPYDTLFLTAICIIWLFRMAPLTTSTINGDTCPPIHYRIWQNDHLRYTNVHFTIRSNRLIGWLPHVNVYPV